MKIFLFLIVIFSQYKDKIVAVIDKEVVLLSEIDEIFDFYKLQSGKDFSPEEEKEVKMQILQEIIREKLLYLEAKKDTLINVKDEEVEKELDNKIEEIKNQIGEENFFKELEKEDLTVEKLKENYRENVRRSLFIQKYISMYIYPKIVISPEEVKKFYEEKKDSIPEKEEGFYISHILIRILPDKEKLKEAKIKSEEVYKKLKSGGDFGYLALKYSDDRKTALEGGEVGYIRKGILPPEIENKIFSLKKGEFTEPIESDYGYYIFKVLDKKKDEVKIAQIVIGVLPEKEDTLKAFERAKEAREYAIKEGFEKAVLKYSDDFITKKEGGSLGFLPSRGMDERIKNVLKKLKENEISEIILGDIGYHIFKLDKYEKGGKPSFEEIQNDLKNLIMQRKLKKEIERITEKIKKNVFVEIKGFED
ncbi:MAG: peptidylprolyl isomerase [candidate division WOR-3 bacterium]